MKFLLSCLISLFSIAAFAQDVAPSKPLTISFDQIEKASTLQELVPEFYGELKDVKSYKLTLAVPRKDLEKIETKGAAVPAKFKELALAQSKSGKTLIVYVDDVRFGVEKIETLPAKVFKVQ